MATSTHNGRQAHDPAGDVIMSNDIMSSSDILEPDFHAELFLPYGNEGIDYFRMRNMGYERSVAQETYSHFEKGLTSTHVVVDDASASATAGATVTYTVSNSAANSTSGTTIGTIFPRVGEYVMFSNTGGGTTYTNKGVVTAVVPAGATTDGTFTVKPMSGLKLPAVTSGGSIAAGVAENEIIIWSGGSGEASGVIAPAITYYEKFSNNVQIIKEKVSETGTALSNGTRVKGNGKGIWFAQLMDGERRLYKKMDGAWMHGEGQTAMTGITDSTSEVDADRTLTKGLIPTIEERGITSTWGTSTFTTDFKDYASDFEAEYVPQTTPIWFKAGKEVRNSFDDQIVTAFGGTSQEFIKSSIEKELYGKQIQKLTVGFNYISVYGRDYMVETNLAWSDPNSYGAKGFTYNEMALAIPVKQARKVKGVGSGVKIGTVGIVHKEIGGYSRKMRVGSLSGFGSNISGEPITSETDLTKYMWLTHFGAEFAEVNSMIKIVKA